MNINIMIVSHLYYAGEDLAEILREYIDSHTLKDITVNMYVVYRVPYIESMISHTDIVIGNIMCNDYDKYGVAVGVYYDSADLAREHGKRYINTHLAKFFPRMVASAVKQIAKKKTKVAAKNLA